MIKTILLLSILIFSGLNNANSTNSFVSEIESAHKKEEFLSKKAISFDIDVFFGGNQAFKGKVTMLTNSTRIRMDMEDGVSLIYDGDKVYQTPSEAEVKGARFGIFTWSYFFLFPYKLSDPGTIWQDYENNKLNGKPYKTQKLTFDKGVGDSPDDWYIVYADTDSNIVKYSAYIVTLFQAKEEAEKDPHAIEYSNYQVVDGIPISTRWEFWGWKNDKGLTDNLGYADLTNIQFINVEPGFFSKPENSKIIE
ncbi:MAG: DUF6503 family protein [Thermodesulfobacteriota bacterium]